MKKVLITGTGSPLNSAIAKQLRDQGYDTIIVQDEPKRQYLEINGIQYDTREENKSKYNGKLAYIAAMLAITGMMMPSVKGKSMPEYNLVEEYTLIQQKKSKLSRSEREHVVRHFNRVFKKVEP